MSTLRTSYLVVGSGIFGASTALYLRRSKPWANVTIVDRVPYPNPGGASHDLNKIIRADYADRFYMKLALEAQQDWRDEAMFSQWYHESGMCFTADDAGWTSLCYENFKSLGIETGGRMLSHREAREMFPMFKSADWEESDAIWYNPQSGWADAGAAMQAILDAAVKEGVIGVRLDHGEKIIADTVILCTGARTAKLLADSAPDDHELQIKDRMIAAGAIQCLVKCDKEYLELYQDGPVFFNGADYIQGESIPPNANRLLKFNYEGSFSNLIHHPASGQTISVPPDQEAKTCWTRNVPETLKKEVLNVVWSMYGKDAPGLQPVEFRMCWDAITPNQDWIISPHPHCKSLYIAAGGSFHSWKFLPIIGKYVVQMMDGELAEEMKQRWAWDRDQSGAACPMYWPIRDLKDIP